MRNALVEDRAIARGTCRTGTDAAGGNPHD